MERLRIMTAMLQLDHDEAALQLVREHGQNARQQIADNIVAAIRVYDLDAAKAWDRVGRAVDSQLSDGTRRSG